MTPSYQDDSAQVFHGDAREVLSSLPAESVHVAITSPPYFGLRKYAGVQPSVWDDPGGCEHEWGDRMTVDDVREETISGKTRTTERFYGEPSRRFNGNHEKHTDSQVCLRCGAQLCCLGLERTPADYVRHLVEVFRAIFRVLRADGTAFVNIGSSYAGSYGNQGRKVGRGSQRPINGPMMQNLDAGYPDFESGTGTRNGGVRAKCDLLIPDRLRIALVDDGWVVRVRAFPWIKRSCMPGSQRDRATVATEDWVMLSKQGSYFWDETAVRRESAQTDRLGTVQVGGAKGADVHHSPGPMFPRSTTTRCLRTTDAYFDSLDALIASTRADLAHWERIRHDGGLLLDHDGLPLALDVVSSGSDLEHYASYPEAVVTPFVLGSTSEHGCCKDCGAPWERVTEVDDTLAKSRRGTASYGSRGLEAGNRYASATPGYTMKVTTLGWRRTCTHQDAERIPAVVLDPFLGSGTTAVVAKKLGRCAIGVDASQHYVAMSGRRLAGTTPALAALAVPRDTPTQLELEAGP